MVMPSRRYIGAVALLNLLISWSIIAPAVSSIPRSSASSSSTVSSPFEPSSDVRRPPWNPSQKINDHGYLKQLYRRIPAEITGETTESNNHNYSDRSEETVVIRQVPGDGDCLFHALAIALSFTEDGHLMRLDTQQGLKDLKESSRKLRRMAVECLSSCTKSQHKRSSKPPTKRYKRLFIQGSDTMKTSQLLSTAASQYGISPEEYCELMMQDSYWGGGPEIVALCAVLRRPIHVYELVPLVDDTDGESDDKCAVSENNGEQHQEEETALKENRTSNQFCLRLLAAFGSPKFDSKEPLHILSADSRFPDIEPHCALKDGNHFLALFPVDQMRACLRDYYVNGSKERSVNDRNQRVRGGGSTAVGIDDGVVLEVDGVDDVTGLTWLFHGEWYDDLPCQVVPGRCESDKDDEGGKRSRFRFGLKLRKHRDLQSTKEDGLSVYRPKSMTRFIGYWINVFVRILAYCGDMI